MTPESQRRDVVLVVDDSPETLRFLTDALEQAGLTVVVATEGAAALRIAAKLTPNVVLMDAVMPGMDGFETCVRLRQRPALAHVPVIFMTGLSETEHIVKGFAAGGVDHISKPIVVAELLVRMRVHLANSKLTKSAHVALDASGRYLIAVDGEGRVLWFTPQARRLLSGFAGDGTADLRLPVELKTWLKFCVGGGSSTQKHMSIAANPDLHVFFVGLIGPDEFLIRLSDKNAKSAELLLKDRLRLTAREAEVLHWITRGKSNRDIATILGLSSRTVDKHLEQIYAKLGVENRTSAAALAVEAIEDFSPPDIDSTNEKPC